VNVAEAGSRPRNKIPRHGRRLRLDNHGQETLTPPAYQRHHQEHHRHGAKAEANLFFPVTPPPPQRRQTETYSYYLHIGNTELRFPCSPAAEAADGEKSNRRSGQRRKEENLSPPFSPLSSTIEEKREGGALQYSFWCYAEEIWEGITCDILRSVDSGVLRSVDAAVMTP
jgi:hypothetical protein